MYENIASLRRWLRSTFMWNYSLRLLLEFTLDLSILSMMDIYCNKLANWGYKVSFSISICSLVAIVSLMLSIRCWLRKIDINKPAVVSAVGTLYEGLIR